MPAYAFSSDWFSEHIPLFERYVLPLAGSPCRLLEIGAYEGRATTWLADHVLTHPEARLDAIDILRLRAFSANISMTPRAAQITLHVGVSRKILPRFAPDSFDFIYVDGSHATIDVLEDAVSAYRLAKRGAIIAFDDYAWDDPVFAQCGIPKPAVDAFLTLYAHPTRYDPLVDLLEMGRQVWIKKR